MGSATRRRTPTAAGWGSTERTIGSRTYDAGDELDDDFGEDAAAHPRRRPLAILDVDRLSGGRATLLLRVPSAGRVSASVTLPANRRTGAGPFLTTLTGDMRVKRPGRMRLRLDATLAGARVLKRRKSVRTKVVVALFPCHRGSLQLRMRSARV